MLVLGASGYIGGATARALHARGHDVVGLARSEASAARLEEAGLDVWPVHEAAAAMGDWAYGIVMNQRFSTRAGDLLGWEPKGARIADDIEHGSYAQVEAPDVPRGSGATAEPATAVTT
jgi:NAD(P)-dependent dehydrogenase (short-subunit alcohol dehydrogenase family)